MKESPISTSTTQRDRIEPYKLYFLLATVLAYLDVNGMECP